ncbi:Na(+)/H(+) exchange regulatory cofactor NHE-RF1 [Drosophila miranda]|uniref:Na(+)/H(+) exchange regulatory cofactor NHE-RF1 n=1 Tax=Drosophila miranda TaxID=7229 RepID=UPI0007E7D318|nr:Na(+)/H(+) exchange regulatory cofactor NHE-RF1 [Drosophila miranda]XP_033247133.1 Na(+)/H(+) exchange regulatory cofactor NHE-RF1 [Drosophila miranda]
MSTPTTPKTPTPPTLPPGVTKTCHIVKRPDFDGYGFNLHSEKVKPGQFIGKVDAKSPAESAGLKEGDRILEVNGVSIGSETHKQVVARIKAIANEVRLLLIDVDGKPIDVSPPSPSALSNCSEPTNGNGNGNPNVNGNGYEGTKQEMPGASANISSISMVSMKRSSNASSIQSGSTMNASDLDVVDRGIPPPVAAVVASPQQNGSKPSSPSPINNNTLMSTPPPPSAAVASMNSNGNVYSSSNGNTNGTASPTASPTPTAMTAPQTTAPMTAAAGAAGNRAGSLNLPLTVAEMRAKLASKKKYDPKNESVDLKKKFEIIQKL